MQRISCLALLSVGFLLFQCAASGRAEERQKPVPQSPIGYFYCDKQSGACFLKAAKSAMKGPVKFSVQEVWKYNLEERKWTYVAIKTAGDDVIVPGVGQLHAGGGDPNVQAITQTAGLFWVKWSENGMPVAKFLYSGMLCNDVLIGPKRKGDLIATCVPGKDRATATYVPDPEIYCVKK